MSRYQNVKVNSSEGKKDKIERALQAELEVSIKLSHDDLNHGDYVLALTQAQVNKMAKAYENGKGVTIKMSKTQIEYNKKVEGGFIGALLPMLATAGKFLVLKLMEERTSTASIKSLKYSERLPANKRREPLFAESTTDAYK